MCIGSRCDIARRPATRPIRSWRNAATCRWPRLTTRCARPAGAHASLFCERTRERSPATRVPSISHPSDSRMSKPHTRPRHQKPPGPPAKRRHPIVSEHHPLRRIARHHAYGRRGRIRHQVAIDRNPKTFRPARLYPDGSFAAAAGRLRRSPSRPKSGRHRQVGGAATGGRDEPDLAAQCISARDQAEDVLRLIRHNAGDITLVMRLNAQYSSMLRTSLLIAGRLMRVQAARHKREAIEGAATEDAWTHGMLDAGGGGTKRRPLRRRGTKCPYQKMSQILIVRLLRR